MHVHEFSSNFRALLLSEWNNPLAHTSINTGRNSRSIVAMQTCIGLVDYGTRLDAMLPLHNFSFQ